MGVEKQIPIDSGYGARTTAREIIGDLDLSGKTAIVTGGYSGIGLETTRALAGAGARIIVPARAPGKAREALAGIEGDIDLATIDLGDLASVRKFAREFLNGAALHLLINNAGIMACPETRLGPGWEAQFAVNHIGHFVLTEELLPGLEKAKGARVVCLSSTAHKRTPILWDDIHFRTNDYDKWTAYGQSKTANALFAVGLDARLKAKGIRAFAVHPGGIMTPLQRHLQTEEMIAMGWLDKDGKIPPQVAAIFKTPAEGAATTVWCAVSPQLEGRGGVYCEDCDIALNQTKESPRWAHVAPWAVDEDAADRLWAATEDIVAEA